MSYIDNVSLCINSFDTPRPGGENFNSVFNLISPELKSILPPLESNTILPPLPVGPLDNNRILPTVRICVESSFNKNAPPEQFTMKSFDASNCIFPVVWSSLIIPPDVFNKYPRFVLNCISPETSIDKYPVDVSEVPLSPINNCPPDVSICDVREAFIIRFVVRVVKIPPSWNLMVASGSFVLFVETSL